MFALFQPDGVDWEEQLRNLKEENDTDEFTISEKPGPRCVFCYIYY